MIASDHRFAIPPAHRLSPLAKKIPLHRELTDLGMEIVNLIIVVHSTFVGAIGKHRT